ncbi:MAG: thiamine-binding protein [Caldisericota bacterium]|jgi:uncharacterized protein YqgV (UPF0045/DUF77 family)|nr:thiamine-binding protein [Caldisericota bacterium]
MPVKVEAQAILFPYDGSRAAAVTKRFVDVLEAAGVRCVVGNMATSCYGEMDTVFQSIRKAFELIATDERLGISIVIANDIPAIGKPS